MGWQQLSSDPESFKNSLSELFGKEGNLIF